MSVYHEIREFLPQIINPVVFEIGAHIGTDTIKLVRMLTGNYQYFAFEPDPRNIAKLRKLRRAINKPFEIVPLVVANQNTPIKFYLSSGDNPKGGNREHTDSSSIRKPYLNLKKRPWMRFDEGKLFKCTKLDTFRAEKNLGVIDFIWADVQGAEVDMIHGAQRTLKNTRYFFTECIEQELYKGQQGYVGIMRALPGRWKQIYKTRTDILLKNMKL